MNTTSGTRSDQEAVTRRYDRDARFYDLCDKPMDLLGVGRRRKRLLSQARGRTLEVGVGTGRNLPLYPFGVQLSGIDVSANMLAKADDAAERRHVAVDLQIADAQHLAFPDGPFDTVTATCVFCSVADRLNPLVSRLLGPDINRRTEDNVAAAGLDIVDVRRWAVWREITARPATSDTPVREDKS